VVVGQNTLSAIGVRSILSRFNELGKPSCASVSGKPSSSKLRFGKLSMVSLALVGISQVSLKLTKVDFISLGYAS